MASLGEGARRTHLVVALVELAADGRDDLVEGARVLGLDARDAEGRGRLLVDDLAEARLALDDAVRDAHLAAERRQPDNNLHGGEDRRKQGGKARPRRREKGGRVVNIWCGPGKGHGDTGKCRRRSFPQRNKRVATPALASTPLGVPPSQQRLPAKAALWGGNQPPVQAPSLNRHKCAKTASTGAFECGQERGWAKVIDSATGRSAAAGKGRGKTRQPGSMSRSTAKSTRCKDPLHGAWGTKRPRKRGQGAKSPEGNPLLPLVQRSSGWARARSRRLPWGPQA